MAAKNVKLNLKEKAALLQLQEGRQKQENKQTEFRRWKKFVDPRTLARFKNNLGNQNTPMLSLIDSSGAPKQPLLDKVILMAYSATFRSELSDTFSEWYGQQSFAFSEQ
jgi:hypothetical protein